MRAFHVPGQCLAAVLLIGAAPAAPPPTQTDVARGLFGGREPEPSDEEEAAGQAEPAPASPTAPAVEAPGASTQAYDARVRQSFAAAEAVRGKLDGAWTLSTRNQDLLRFQLTDKGDGQVEGAWRDLRRPGSLEASGFVDEVELAWPKLDLRFKAAGSGDIRIAVQAASDGRWTGKLWRGDEVFDVVLRRAP